MSHGLLEILKYFFLAILWLFFIYAARMVLVDSRRSNSEAHGAVDDVEGRPDRRSPVKLRITEGLYKGETIELTREFIFGRSASCDISLEGDTYASSVHARMFLRDNDVIVEDLGSTNGTRVNNELTEGPVTVGRGDIVQIGGTILEVRR